MSAHRNGQFPLSMMLPIATGTNSDGYWEHRLAPGQKRRWEALVEDVLANERVRLKITDGWNAYRPLDAQWTAYRNNPPGMAAYPGTSSHGGIYNGRDAMAIDVANWGLLGKDKFYAYARKHGFTAGAISNEPWHIIDYNPWVVPAGGGSTPFTPPTPSEEDDMLALRITDYQGNKHLCTLGLGVFRHLIAGDNPERIKNAIRADDQWTDISLPELPVFLKTYGCRGQIWRNENGGFQVLDSLASQEAGHDVVVAGGMWSAAISR